MLDFLHARGNRERRIQRYVVSEVRRKLLCQLRDPLAHILRGLHRVRAWQLVNRQNRRRLPIKTSCQVICLRAEFQPRHILHLQDSSIRIRAQNNIPELFRGLEAPRRAYGIRELLSRRYGLAADLPRRIHVVLHLHRVDDLRHGHVQLRQLVRLDPYAHRVLARAKHQHARDSIHTCQFIGQVDVRIVRQENVVVRTVRRINRDDHQRRRERFLHDHARCIHFRRQLRLGLRNAQLRQHLIDIRIRRHVEVHGDRRLPVVRVRGVHVVHVVHARDRLLQRRRHRLLQRDRIRARIRRLHLNLRRNDVGKLRRRQLEETHASDQHHQNGDNHGDDRTVDKKLGHELLGLGVRV